MSPVSSGDTGRARPSTCPSPSGTTRPCEAGSLAHGRGPVGGLQPRTRDREHRRGRLRCADRARRDRGPRRRGPASFDTDEHPRRGLTLEGMAELKALHPEIDGFTVTAGNAAGINDAAAAVLLTDADYAAVERHSSRSPRSGPGPRWGSLLGAPGWPRSTRFRRRWLGRSSTPARHRSLRDQRGLLLGSRRHHARSASTRRSATSTGAAAASGTRSPPLERAWSSPWCTSSGDAARASAASPCARAAAWAWRW